MIARKKSMIAKKKQLEKSFYATVMFSISKVFLALGQPFWLQMSSNENYRFLVRWFLIDNFFDRRHMKLIMEPSCSPCRSGLKHVLFDLVRLISKFDFRSGRIRSMSDHDSSRSNCI